MNHQHCASTQTLLIHPSNYTQVRPITQSKHNHNGRGERSTLADRQAGTGVSPRFDLVSPFCMARSARVLIRDGTCRKRSVVSSSVLSSCAGLKAPRFSLQKRPITTVSVTAFNTHNLTLLSPLPGRRSIHTQPNTIVTTTARVIPFNIYTT